MQDICSMQIFMLCGFNPEQFNETALPVMNSHSPAGTSTKTIIHFTKQVISWEFAQYDYGWAENMLVYGQMLPPNYHLNKVTAPVYLHYADNDWLAHPLDVQRIANNLGNLKAMIKMAPPMFNHIDFIWGIDATTLFTSWCPEFEDTQYEGTCAKEMFPLTTRTSLAACLIALVLLLANRVGGLQIVNSANEEVFADHLTTFTDANDAYVDLDPAMMIARAGYPAESHIVPTEDGYLLTVHRIPPHKNGPGHKHPVLLQHGLVSSSADWLTLGPGKALAYVLADEGYDVWIGNIRGNTYSRVHFNLSTSDPKFWDFSFHEMGYYDVPAMTSFILKKSGQAQLSYVGHSMGTTMFWVFCSSRPELQHRIRQMHALAPVAFLTRMKSPLRTMAPFERELQISLALIGEHEFLRHGAITGYLEEEFLKINHIGTKGAEYLFYFICGYDPDQFNKTLLPLILGHTPAGASTQTVLHFLQEVNSGKFRQYDEGTAAGNRRKYGTPEPPEYDLSKIEVPVYMHYGLNDYLAAEEDVMELINARKLVYDPLITALKNGSHKVKDKLSKEELSNDLASLSAKMSEGKNFLVTSYKEHAKPTTDQLVNQLKQLNERRVSAELAQHWGPNLLGFLEKLEKRVNLMEKDSEAKIAALGAEEQEWFRLALRKTKLYPDLLVTKSAPYLSRMLSTLSQKKRMKRKTFWRLDCQLLVAFVVGAISGFLYADFAIAQHQVAHYKHAQVGRGIGEMNQEKTLLLRKLQNIKSAELKILKQRLRRHQRLICWIMTHSRNHASKAQTVRATWGRFCDVTLFVSDELDEKLFPMIKVEAPPGRDSLWHKVRAAFKFIHSNFSGKYDWVMKADDDT
ncbi:Hypothetical predicted protein [Cloeon dipterum]|nr:Hypothetical predicted protein [Cloeon dipterum]